MTLKSRDDRFTDMTNNTPAQKLTIVGPNLPSEAVATFYVHATGCADLRRGMMRGAEKFRGTYASRFEVEADVYDFAPAESPDYTLGDYQSEFHFAPCVEIPEDDEEPEVRKSNGPATGSAIVAALEEAWAAAQDRVPDLPDVVIITGTGLMGRGAKWGHYGRDRWVKALDEGRLPEVFIAGERLHCGARGTLSTLLHEGAHALAAVRGIQDTSRQGRYHNQKFLDLAEELGLEYAGGENAHPVIGWSETRLTEDTIEEYADELDALADAIALSLDTFVSLGLVDKEGNPVGGNAKGTAEGEGAAPPKPRAKGKSRNNPKATCGCGRIIRASASVLAEAPIICGACEKPFTAED